MRMTSADLCEKTEHQGVAWNVEAEGPKEATATEKVQGDETLNRQASRDLKKWMHELKHDLEDSLTFDRRGPGGEESYQVHKKKIAMLMDLSVDMEEAQSRDDTMAIWRKWKSERESINITEDAILQTYGADSSMGCVDVCQGGHTIAICVNGAFDEYVVDNLHRRASEVLRGARDQAGHYSPYAGAAEGARR